ncbi:hypothetical protein BKE38_08705 [Pseudoroseomonas deserti]|uniref:Uncharacterized protein n=1 Tax=Teichococcus deserti TaxID=1817963 RepID=A0A1V2H596_9PROT|nr:hypothetical protein [Pseudoroseomonas deserti]ONG55737.1 hypothetical protein BKE38_08705 [Pseudoroseomonas deserti]
MSAFHTFTEAQKVAVRRHLGYPAIGNGDNAFFSYLHHNEYAVLEFRLANLTDEDAALIVGRFLPNLDKLDQALIDASCGLDTDEAGIWKRNKNELRDREALYLREAQALAGHIGVPFGPARSACGPNIRVIV